MGLDLYGIGNALVDMEVELGDAELAKLGFDKGGMTLVEAEDALGLLSHFGQRVHNRTSGGSAANTIITAAHFGLDCAYGCRLGADDTGRFFLKDLRDNGVASGLTESTLAEGYSGTCVVMVSPDAERTMATFLGVSAEFSTEDLDSAAIASAKCLYIEGYLLSSESGRQAALAAQQIAKAAGVKVALTLSDTFIVSAFRSAIDALMDNGVDILFANWEEATLFTGASSVEGTVSALREYGCMGAVTLGAEGAMVFDGDGQASIASPVVKAVDSNGAGDSFAGAFLSAYLRDSNLEIAGRWGCVTASQVVSAFGARLSQDKVAQLKLA